MYPSLESKLEKLTLFKPVVEKVHVIKTERPITPIYDEVLEPAGSLDELHQLLKRRLLVTRTWALYFLSAAEQEELASILFSEVTRIWPDLQSCGHMALLNEYQNKNMLRRMTIYVVTTCEILFDRHIEIFQNMLKSGVFEKFANFTRIKQLLADEAVRLLDVLTVRRYIGDDIRALDNDQLEPVTDDKKTSDMSFANLVKLSRPSLDAKYKWTLESDIKALKAKLPNLDLTVLRSVLSTLPPLPPISLLDQINEHGFTVVADALSDKANNITNNDNLFGESLLITSSRFMVDRKVSNVISKRSISATDTLKFYEPEFSTSFKAETFITQPVELGVEDKKAMIKSMQKAKIPEDGDIAIQPLLKASLFLEGVVKRTMEKEQRLAEIGKIIDELENKRRVEVRRSPYLQPDYFEVHISKDVVMRASGPRITERQLEASISLQSFHPLFDELNFDITETDVAEMDETLFVNRELADVYKEIVAVIPKDYLEVSNDISVRPAANSQFDLARCIASSRLQRSTGGGSAAITKLPPSTALPLGLQEAPWHKEGFKSWVKNGPSKVLCTTNRNRLIQPLPPGSAGVGRTLTEHLPEYMDPKMFMQWHSWWRQLFNMEDYYKYVNRQDNDFLSYIFHLWGDEGGRLDSGLGLSSGPGTPISVGGSPIRPKKDHSSLSSARQSVLPLSGTPAPDMWVVEASTKDKLETEAEMNEKTIKAVEIAKEGARIYTIGQTQNISINDLAVMRIEKRRKEEFARRRLTADENLEKELAALTIQQRFERVWDLLRLDEDFRSRQVFKLSGSDTSRLLHIVKLWENVAHAILKREYILGQFEQFERIASDPNRFFEKGYLGSTHARLDEEMVRASLFKQLDKLDVKVKAEISRLSNGTGGEVALFRGQPYIEKMVGDRVQVLFWLSEERKANAIRRHLADEKLNEALLNSSLIGPASAFTSMTPRTFKQQQQQVHLASSAPLPLTIADILSQL